MFNLLDLPSSDRVRQRAKMVVDIAMVEAEQVSINGVRGGQKSRSKKDDLAHHNGLFGTMHGNLAPMLYGDNLTTTPMGGARIIDAEANSYKMSNVSILMHELGKPPEYSVRNRMLGEYAPKGAKCELAAISNQVHHVEMTASYSLGGVEFQPSAEHYAFIPNSQLRWTGLIFGQHTVLGLPHGTGEKWALVQPSVMIAQVCTSCYYGGNPALSVQGLTGRQLWYTGGWAFFEAVDAGGAGQTAWAAARPAWSGFNTSIPPPIPHGCHYCDCEKTAGKGCPGHCLNGECKYFNMTSGTLPHNDPLAPIIIVAGEMKDFGGPDQFASAVLAAPLAVAKTNGSEVPSSVKFEWQAHAYEFFPNPSPRGSATSGSYRLPTVDGVPIDVSPEFAYSGPHLNAALGSNVVELKYKDYILEYNFSDDSIKRKGK
jgi:hypothetical protein